MQWEEFNRLAKTEVTYEVYSEQIEPAYMVLPDAGVDKQKFIKWWKTNPELIRNISQLALIEMSLRRENADLRKCLENHTRQEREVTMERDHLRQDVEELTKQNWILKLRAAFAPDKLIAETRLEIFPEYWKAAKEAQDYGIVQDMKKTSTSAELGILGATE